MAFYSMMCVCLLAALVAQAAAHNATIYCGAVVQAVEWEVRVRDTHTGPGLTPCFSRREKPREKPRLNK